MSSCNCKYLTKARITSEIFSRNDLNYAFLRCNRCGGKLGFIPVDEINSVLDLKGAEEANVKIDIEIRPEDSPVVLDTKLRGVEHGFDVPNARGDYVKVKLNSLPNANLNHNYRMDDRVVEMFENNAQTLLGDTLEEILQEKHDKEERLDGSFGEYIESEILNKVFKKLDFGLTTLRKDREHKKEIEQWTEGHDMEKVDEIDRVCEKHGVQFSNDAFEYVYENITLNQLDSFLAWLINPDILSPNRFINIDLPHSPPNLILRIRLEKEYLINAFQQWEKHERQKEEKTSVVEKYYDSEPREKVYGHQIFNDEKLLNLIVDDILYNIGEEGFHALEKLSTKEGITIKELGVPTDILVKLRNFALINTTVHNNRAHYYLKEGAPVKDLLDKWRERQPCECEIDEQFYNWLKNQYNWCDSYYLKLCRVLVKSPNKLNKSDKKVLKRARELYNKYQNYKETLNEPVDYGYLSKIDKEYFDSLRKTIK